MILNYHQSDLSHSCNNMVIINKRDETFYRIKHPVNTGTWLTLVTPNWWSCKFWYFWGFGNRITDLIQTCRLYRFSQHYCPLTNITRPCIRIIYFVHITYLVKLYLVLWVPLQFLDVDICPFSPFMSPLPGTCFYTLFACWSWIINYLNSPLFTMTATWVP